MPNEIHHTAIVYPNVKLGDNISIGEYCVIGSSPDERGNPMALGEVIISDNVTIKSHTIISAPSSPAKFTFIGRDTFVMSGCYIAHDVTIGENVEISPKVTIGGYAEIGDNARLKIGCTIRNRVKIGSHTTIGMGSVVTKDVPDNEVWIGNPAKEKPNQSKDETS